MQDNSARRGSGAKRPGMLDLVLLVRGFQVSKCWKKGAAKTLYALSGTKREKVLTSTLDQLGGEVPEGASPRNKDERLLQLAADMGAALKRPREAFESAIAAWIEQRGQCTTGGTAEMLTALRGCKQTHARRGDSKDSNRNFQ